MEEKTGRKNHGGEMMEEESWRRDREEKSWRTHHRGEIMEEKAWTRNHGEENMQKKSWRRNHRGHPEAEHPGVAQDAPRRSPGSTQEAPRIFRFLLMLGVTLPRGADAHVRSIGSIGHRFNSPYGLQNVYTRYVETCRQAL